MDIIGAITSIAALVQICKDVFTSIRNTATVNEAIQSLHNEIDMLSLVIELLRKSSNDPLFIEVFSLRCRSSQDIWSAFKQLLNDCQGTLEGIESMIRKFQTKRLSIKRYILSCDRAQKVAMYQLRVSSIRQMIPPYLNILSLFIPSL
jgi:hypothetical protein